MAVRKRASEPETIVLSMTSLSAAERPALDIVAGSHEDELLADEGKTKQSLRRSLTDGMLALADQAMVSLTSFLTMLLVVKLCTRGDLNLFALTFSVFSVFRVAQERALAAPYVVFAHQPGTDRASFLGSSLIHQASFGILSAALLAALAIGFKVVGGPGGIGPDGIDSCLLAAAVASLFVLLRDHLRAISCSHFRYAAACMISGFALLIQLGLMYAAYRFGFLTVQVVFLTMGLSSLISCAIWFAMRLEPVRFVANRIVEDWRVVFRYSRWLVAARCFPTVASSLMPWIVYWAIDENASGAFASCITLANITMMFVFGMNSYFQPRTVAALHRHGTGAMCRTLLESVAVYAIILSSLCVVFVVAGGWLMRSIYGAEFGAYGHVVAVLGLNTLIVSFSIVAGNGMAALGRPKGLFIGEVAFAVVAVSLALLLSAPFGLVGTATALCGASLASTIVSVYIFRKLLSEASTPETQS